MRILITGGAGNIGGSLARLLVKDLDNYVVIVDNLITGSYDKLPDQRNKNWSFIEADVNNFDAISSIIVSDAFDYIFHYAAIVGVQRTLMNPKLVLNDIDGIKNILDLAKKTSIKRVFFSSSSEVYGEPVESPQCEATTPLNSKLPYAIVKNVGEAFCRTYQLEFGLDYTIFRFFNTYGPLQSDDFVITKFIKQAIQNNDLTIYGDGLQTRTFCFIEDNLEATISSMKNNIWINDVVNIGSDFEMTIVDLAKVVLAVTKSKSKIVHLPALKEGDMTRRKPDISKMMNVLGRNLTKIEDGIRLTTEFVQKKK